MDAATEELCDRFATEFERYGLSRTLGRTFGYLMIQPEPVPLQRIAADLGFSRPTASITLRHAVLSGFAEKSNRTSDRQDYYRLPPRVWQDSTTAKMQSLYAWKTYLAVFRRAAPALAPVVVSRLTEMTDFFTFVEERFSTLTEDYEKWRNEREAGGSGQSSNRG